MNEIEEHNRGRTWMSRITWRKIWRTSITAMHLIGTVVYFSSLIYQEIINDRTDPRSTYVGDWKYLTYWNLVFQFVFSSLSLAVDLMKKRRESDRFTEFLDRFFFCVAYPFSMFVCVSFWALHLTDDSSVRNPNVTNRFPEWYNQVTHTMNGLVMLLEVILVHHTEPDRKNSILILVLLYAIYSFLMYGIGTYNQVWIYPFLGRMRWSQRILFAILGALKMISNYMVCVYLNSLFWPQNRIDSFRRLFVE